MEKIENIYFTFFKNIKIFLLFIEGPLNIYVYVCVCVCVCVCIRGSFNK